MRRDFLKNLGIEDKELIDKILDENSSDIGRAKGELETYKNKAADLEQELNKKISEINQLKKSSEDVDVLNNKIAQLETDKTNLTNELNTKLTQIQKTHAIENGVRDAKAKNVKAVMALLDLEKITFEENQLNGLSEQLENLKVGEDTAFLFGENQKPRGVNLNNPPYNGGTPPTSTTFAEAIAKVYSH